MLEFFRIYQRGFFIVVTVVVIASFCFFGTYGTFTPKVERKDRVIGQIVDGSPMMQFDVQRMALFIAHDRNDPLSGIPNLCNDGVIQTDFLRTRLADLLVKSYFDELKGDFGPRLAAAKRFRPYAHPDISFLSAKTIWERIIPAMNHEIDALQAENEVAVSTFLHLSRLYQYQSRFQPEMLRRILIHQQKQCSWLNVDQRLSTEDLSLFGFHSLSDWFGKDFVDLIAQFILNAAATAEAKGYRVSLQEAKGDLIHNFDESVKQIGQHLNFYDHLHRHGFDEKSAAEVWRKVLLFRHYFQDIGEAAFVDRLPYRDFAGFAKEAAIVQRYQWPICLNSAQDLAEFQFYIEAVCPKSKGLLPDAVLTVEEVEEKVPELVETTYQAYVAEVSKKEVALRPSVKQVWEWQLDENNWAALRNKFSSLGSAATREERFSLLEKLDPKLRAEINLYSREKLVDENPAWMEEALAAAPLKEKTWSVSGSEDPEIQAEGKLFRIENLKIVEEKHILTFNDARKVLSKLVCEKKGGYEKEKNPFFSAAKESMAAVQTDPIDARWVQNGTDPILDQFKLERKEMQILRTSQENWMKEQAFMMLPDFWSPIHVAEDGQIVFFYLQEKKMNSEPILDQLAVGKEILAADAKAYVAERLLQTIKKKHSIVIPVQKEESHESI